MAELRHEGNGFGGAIKSPNIEHGEKIGLESSEYELI